MSMENRIEKLERHSNPDKKIEFRYIEEDDPDREMKIQLAEQEAQATGDYLVILDHADGQL